MSNLDQNIHSHATGVAAKTAAEHQDPQEIVFYSGWFCPFVQRTWITLEERNIPYQYKEVNPYKKEPHFLAVNPKGLVPAIEYHGKALYESLVLCEFLEDAYPEHAPRLLPGDPYERAYARIWTDFISKSVMPAFYRTLQAQEPEKQREGRDELYSALGQLAKQRRGPYFLGAQYSLVDVAVTPWACREFLLEEYREYKRADVPDGWKEWADLLEQRESVRKTLSDKEKYTHVYQRYLDDATQSEVGKATRSGKNLP